MTARALDMNNQSSSAVSTAIDFPKSDSSPFADGYDIDGERERLADLLTQDSVDPGDPRYQRYLLLEERETELRKLQRNFTSRDAANTEVPDKEAASFRDMGKLVVSDDESDSMDIHTLHAARLFLGREVKPGEKGYGMTGGKKVASCLRAIWHMSSNDNPYADYALILATERMDEVRREIDKQVSQMNGELSDLRDQGLNFSVLKNPKPFRVHLGFRSPYGYSVIMLVNRFDYYVRMVKTMVSKSLMNDRIGREKIYDVMSKCRSIFEEVVRYQRTLSREQLRALSRSDFLPVASSDGKKRVQAICAILGEIDRDVFSGKIVPRHSKRKVNLSAAELKLLDEVPLSADTLIDTAEELL